MNVAILRHVFEDNGRARFQSGIREPPRDYLPASGMELITGRVEHTWHGLKATDGHEKERQAL